MRKYGIAIGTIRHIGLLPVAVAKVTKKKVTLFDCYTGRVNSITRKAYFKLRLFIPDEFNLILLSQEELDAYNRKRNDVETEIKERFVAFLKCKGWRVPHENTSYYFASTIKAPIPTKLRFQVERA